MLETTLESPLDCKEIQPVNPKGNQPCIFIEGLMLKLQCFGHLMQRLNSLGKNSDAGNDLGQEGKRVIENKMVGWHYPPHWTCFYCCSVTQSCLTLCDPMDCSTPSFPALHYLPEFAQTHVHCCWCHPTISFSVTPFSPPTFSLSQHQGLFQWVDSSHQVAKVLEFQLQYQSFQWTFKVDFL